MPSIFYEQRPELFFVGHMCDHAFPTHVHDPVEILCLTHGIVDTTIGSDRFRMRPGDIAVSFPSVPHSLDFVSEDAVGLAMFFLPDAISEFTGTFRTRLPENPVLTANAVPLEIPLIIRQMQKLSAQGGSPLLPGYLHLFLSYLFCQLELKPRTKQMQSGLAQQVLHYISEHFTEPLTQENVSRTLGISGTHLSHIFSQQLNVNFREYINALRIDRACSLLNDSSLPISRIAEMCGFGNPRTFHRAFQARCQTSPNKYRAKLLGKSEALQAEGSAP